MILKISATKNFNAGAIVVTPKSIFLRKNTSYDVFFHSLLFLPNPQCMFPVIPVPYVIHVPWTHLTQDCKLHIDGFSHFCTAHGR